MNIAQMSKLTNINKNNIKLDTRFTYDILSEQHLDQVVDVFTHAFCYSEPMTHYLKMDADKYKIFARSVAEQAARDQFSIVALDKGKVVACALMEDFTVPGKIPDFDPKFESILALLDNLSHGFFLNKNFNRRQIAHLFITAVHEQYRRQGLSKQVNFLAMDLAKENNFDFVYCELTHVYNEKGIISHLKNKKKLIGSCKYDQFTHNGTRPFAHLEGFANSYLWAIGENTSLTYRQGKEVFIEKLI